MSQRARGASPAVSLFPFLAVLVCAMGAMILLLLVTTRRTRQVAILRARAAQVVVDESRQLTMKATRPVPEESSPVPETPVIKRAAPTPPPAPPAKVVVNDNAASLAEIEKAKRRVESLRISRERRKSLLDKLPLQTREIQERVEGAASKIGSLQSQLEAVRRGKQDVVQTGLSIDGKQGALREQLSSLEQELQKVREQQQQAQSKFAIIPYEGRSGTTRRPIMIECRDDALRFLPEKVILTPDDLDGFTPGYNPLLAGVLALVEYWNAHDATTPEQEPEPYVLLIIRPDGSVPFYAARALLAPLKQSFGYELLEKDWELALPEVDPAAQKACATAVAQTLAQRDKLIQAINSGRAPRTEQIHFRRGAMGFAEADKDETESGRGGPDSRRGSNRMAPNGPAGTYAERGESGLSEGSSRARGSSSRPDDWLTGGSGNPDRWSNTNDSSDATSSPNRGGAAMRPEETKLWDETRGPAAGALSSRDGSENMGNAMNRRETAAPNSFGEAGQYPSQRTMSQRDVRSGADRNSFSATSEQDRSAFAGGAAAGSEVGDRSKDLPPWAELLDNQDGPPSNARSGTGGSSDGSPSGMEMSLPSLGKPSDELARYQDIETLLATKRWGLSGRNGSIGFEHPVPIRVHSDRLVVAESTMPVGRGETREELLTIVAVALDKHARTWGKPPENFYWIPTLQFIVSPGGVQHYERMHEAFRKAGMFSSVQFTLDN